MAGTDRQKPREKPPRGHYCCICGEYKANEKFSGSGQSSHTCKACAALSGVERREMPALRKIEGMARRNLSGDEIAWLARRMRDSNPQIAQAAQEVYDIRFPRFFRTQKQKGITAFSLALFIRGDVRNVYGNDTPVHARMTLHRDGLLRRTDYAAPEDERDVETTVEGRKARAFLKSVIHESNALFWDEDLSDARDTDDDGDASLFNREIEMEYPIEDRKLARTEEKGEPIWSLHLELNSGDSKAITFYHQMHDEPVKLYWLLMGLFGEEFGNGGDGYISAG